MRVDGELKASIEETLFCGERVYTAQFTRTNGLPALYVGLANTRSEARALLLAYATEHRDFWSRTVAAMEEANG